MSRQKVSNSGLAIGLALLFFGMVWFLARSDNKLSLSDRTNISSLVLAFIGLAVTVWALPRSQRSRMPLPSSELLDLLAEQSKTRYDTAAARCELIGKNLINIQWRTVRASGAVSVDDLGKLLGLQLRNVKIRSIKLDITELGHAWNVVGGRLLITGQSKSGKTSTSILLAREMLEARKEGDPVPVLINIVEWDPENERFDEWMLDQIRRDNLNIIACQENFETLERLIKSRLIIPIIDGLDEMSAELRHNALRGINIAFAGCRFVLTCRLDEFEAIITRHGPVLDDLFHIELMSVTPQMAAAALSVGSTNENGRWGPVISHLTQYPHEKLASVLRSPWHIYLARLCFRAPYSNPSVLLDPGIDIERHLQSEYLNVIYSPEISLHSGFRSYRLDQAMNALIFLSQAMPDQDGQGLNTWEIDRLLNHPSVRRFASLSTGFAASMLSGVTILLVVLQGQNSRARIALLVAITILATFILVSSETEHRLASGHGIYSRMFLFEIGVSGSGFSEVKKKLKSILSKMMPPVAIMGIGMSIFVGYPTAVSRGMAAGFKTGISIGLGFILTSVIVITFIEVFWKAASPIRRARRPAEVIIKKNWKLEALSGLVFGATIGSFATFTLLSIIQPRAAFNIGMVVLVAILIGRLAFSLKFIRTWSEILLAITGNVPWKAMEFVDDAHSRGILFRVGSSYQFRHKSLQDYLVSRARNYDSEYY